MTHFTDWLQSELNERGWGPADLAKRMGSYPATVSNVLNGLRNPGPDFCRGVARALGYPQEFVFRLAGLITDPTPENYDPEAALAAHLIANLPPEKRAAALDYLRYLAQTAQPPPTASPTTLKTKSRATPARER